MKSIVANYQSICLSKCENLTLLNYEKTEEISRYRKMVLFTMFDMPTNTKKDIKYIKFRKNFLEMGFIMFQFSIYIRFCKKFSNGTKI